jgi:D-3-phosphoglycerate dehydrogenase
MYSQPVLSSPREKKRGDVLMVHQLRSRAAILAVPEIEPEADRRRGQDEKIAFIHPDRAPASPGESLRPSDGLCSPRYQQARLKHALARPVIGELSAPHAERLLLLENIDPSAVQALASAGFSQISCLRDAFAGQALHERLRGMAAVGIRSRTRLDAEAIAAGDRLLAIGCFGVGTNQVDLDAARSRGIPVFNSPFANTRSVAELVIGEIVMLFRQVFPRSVAAHAGGWQKSAAGSREIRGKVLGIVGYGNIGAQLSHLAEAMGMKVLYHDVADKLGHGNAERASSLADLLARSDVVSLHVPETEATTRMIGKAELAAMRKGAYLINNSRGTVVDLEALAHELRGGRLAGAAVDVFPKEPSSNSDMLLTPLRGLDNVILTPHIGGSTEEAQQRIGAEVARKLAEFVANGSTAGAVNVPQLKLGDRSAGARFVHLHRKGGGTVRALHDVFARCGAEIACCHYETDSELGYAAFDSNIRRARAPSFLTRWRRLRERSARAFVEAFPAASVFFSPVCGRSVVPQRQKPEFLPPAAKTVIPGLGRRPRTRNPGSMHQKQPPWIPGSPLRCAAPRNDL